MSGVTTGAGSRLDVTLRLAQLQNFCKRDPAGYREDYDAQVRRLESELGILALQPSSEPSKTLLELIPFAAAVASSSYKGQESNRIATILLNLLVGSNQEEASKTSTALVTSVSAWPSAALELDRQVRKVCVSALILMRNKGAVEPLRLLESFFGIMSHISDKGLRIQLYKHILNDIRNINHKGKRDEKVNRAVQSFLHRVLMETAHNAHNGAGPTRAKQLEGVPSPFEMAAKRATDLTCELYRRHVWTDDRTVAIIAQAAQSPYVSVMSRALRFFLGIEERMAEDEREVEANEEAEKERVDYHAFSKKTKARERQTERQVKNRKKMIRKREKATETEDISPDQDRGVEGSRKLFPAMELLRDPQGLAEFVFKRLRNNSAGYKYEIKLLMINFITRLVGNQELLLLPLYPFLQKYMGGKQRDVTGILCFSVQACHEYVPPDEVYGILKTIAHNFITERCSEEQMAVGINAAKAICARVPSVLSVEESSQSSSGCAMDIEAFVQDLAGFVNHRDRSVSTAGKAWVNFIREECPSLLKRKNRGMVGNALARHKQAPLRYGQQKVSSGVEGADLLVEYEAKKALRRRLKGLTEDDETDSDDSLGAEEMEDADMEEEESSTKRPKEKKAGRKRKREEVEEEDDEDGAEEVDEEGETEEIEAEEEEVEEEEVEVDDDNAEAEEKVDEDEMDSNKKEKSDGENSDDDSDDEAPNLVNMDKLDEKPEIDLSKMTPEERERLKLEISSTRVFTAKDFEKMRKLVERENKLKRDPREAARRKREIAQGKDFQLSDDSDIEDDDDVKIAGAVNPTDIMAMMKKKRLNKAERLEKIIAGRTEFEAKAREGGSTNTEKKRRKNFNMTKHSYEARAKGAGKGALNPKRGARKKQMKHDAKKRRRKV